VRAALLYLHVASAVTLIGELLFASLWLRSALARGGGSAITRYALATMAWTSKSVAFPSLLVNLVSGLGLLHAEHVSLSEARWLVVSLILYVLLMGIWHGILTPMRRKMQKLVEAAPAAGYPTEEREASSEFHSMASRWVSASVGAAALLFLILFLMVAKPF
jgi:uncharacterized membrane protein